MAVCPEHGRTRKLGSYYAAVRPDPSKPKGHSPFVVVHACGGRFVALVNGAKREWLHEVVPCDAVHDLMPGEACNVCGLLGQPDAETDREIMDMLGDGPGPATVRDLEKIYLDTPAHPIASGEDKGYECMGDAALNPGPGDSVATCQACGARFNVTLTLQA